MSRPWMPLYIGDYLRDTGDLTTLQHGAYLLLIMHSWQHGKLPESEEGRATVARVPLGKWRLIRAPVEGHFRSDGTHKRIETEIEATERKIMQRRLAGQKGGYRSGITRAIQAATKQRSKAEANMNHALVERSRTNHIKKDNSSTNSESEIGASPPEEAGEKKNGMPVSSYLAKSLQRKGWAP